MVNKIRVIIPSPTIKVDVNRGISVGIPEFKIKAVMEE